MSKSDFSSSHSSNSSTDSDHTDSSLISEESSEEINEEYNTEYIGEILNDRYVLTYEIGSGSFSTVWIALDIVKKRYYAIKIQNCEDYEAGVGEIKILRTISESKSEYLNKLVEKFIHETDKGKNVCKVFGESLKIKY